MWMIHESQLELSPTSNSPRALVATILRVVDLHVRAYTMYASRDLADIDVPLAISLMNLRKSLEGYSCKRSTKRPAPLPACPIV